MPVRLKSNKAYTSTAFKIVETLLHTLRMEMSSLVRLPTVSALFRRTPHTIRTQALFSAKFLF